MSGMLDLSGADTSGFEPLPADTYLMAINEATMVETPEEKKLPKGTPGLKVEFRVTAGEYENRLVWNNYWIPNDKKYDKKKAAFMKGNLVRMLVNAGYDEQEIIENGVTDLEDLKGRELDVTVKIVQNEGYDPQNQVVGTRPAGSRTGASSDLI